MVNLKRKVSRGDCSDCYRYFKRAIQDNRFIPDDTSNNYQSAIDSFATIPLVDDLPCLDSLQSWIDIHVDKQTWAKCYRALNQKKYKTSKQLKSINISHDAYDALQEYTSMQGSHYSEVILTLIENALMENKPKKGALNQYKLSAATPSNVIPLFADELNEEYEEDEDEEELDSDEDFPILGGWGDDFLEYPTRPPGYDFKNNESYKQYRGRIKKITLKKPDIELEGRFHEQIKKRYHLEEATAPQVGVALVALRDMLSKEGLLLKTIGFDEVSISKGIKMTAYQEDEYGYELMTLAADLFGCMISSVSSGKSELSVFCGHPNQVHLAYQTFNYINAYLGMEVEKYIENCHKNTKRKNKYLYAGIHGNELLYSIFSEVMGDYLDHKYLNAEEEKTMRTVVWRKVGCYHDENEPIGGWRD